MKAYFFSSLVIERSSVVLQSEATNKVAAEVGEEGNCSSTRAVPVSVCQIGLLTRCRPNASLPHFSWVFPFCLDKPRIFRRSTQHSTVYLVPSMPLNL